MRAAQSAWRIPGYVAEVRLGSGAAGQVWRGRSTRTGESVALKRLPAPDALGRSAAESEAALLAALEHPNVVRLRELVTTPNAMVLVLDLAEGGSLATLLERRGRLAVGETVSALAPVGAALAHAHSQGVVHGDVAPGNILFCSRGRPMLADLGVARLLGQHGPAMATLPYLDPAVANGSPPGPPSDVFMVAAVTLHCLTGAPAWAGDSVEGIIAVAATGEIEHLEERLGEMPKEVASVLRRGLDPAPYVRGTSAEFALDLRYAATPVAVELTAGRIPPAGRVPHVARHGAAPQAPVAAAPGARRSSIRLGRSSGNRRGEADVHDRLNVIVASPGRPAFAVAESSPSGPDRLPLTHVVRRPPAPKDAQRYRRPWWVLPGLPSGHGASESSMPFTRAWVAVAVVSLTVAGAAAGWWRSTHGAAAPDVPAALVAASSGPVTSPASGASRPPSSTPASPPLPGGPTSTGGSELAWARTLAELDSHRARAFATADAEELARIWSAGPLLRQDTATLRRLTPPGSGCGLVGLITRYRDVRTVRQDADAVTVRATVSVTPARLICTAMLRARTRPSGGRVVRLELARTPRGWRITALVPT
ncbi:MAG: serine/threonine-protein kinase [bacterium]